MSRPQRVVPRADMWPFPDSWLRFFGPVLRERAPEDQVFTAPDGGYVRNGYWRARSGWSRVTKELGLTGVTPHDLRRTFGSLARSAGADLRWMQSAMGHESISTTARIYAHLHDDELDIVAAALDRLSEVDNSTGGAS